MIEHSRSLCCLDEEGGTVAPSVPQWALDKGYRMTTIGQMLPSTAWEKPVTVCVVKDFCQGAGQTQSAFGQACPVLLLGEGKKLCYGVINWPFGWLDGCGVASLMTPTAHRF
ncbi:hypothetical protein [Aeromonas taiwanensis]|uniref:hypothetical protein n=1 Tax=Aeromonas taiwanensis TaxID=633417 RepID=UPI00207C864F|nr:hypothetical protein [Aeromonas taiwanensis]MCO4206174.1 hypothetical protein [Aeromonas taiwanensis]